MTLINWKTSGSALITAFFGFVIFSPDLFSGVPWLVALARYGAAGGLISMGLFAKDKDVTGGTIVQPSNDAAKQSVLNPELKGDTTEKKDEPK
jgi:hypothetical protein